MMHEPEKSDLCKVAKKPANKPGQPGTEPVERRQGAEGNAGESSTRRTLSRASVSQGLDRVYGNLPSLTRGGSPVRESRPPGSVRGVSGNRYPYRDP